MLKRIDMPTNFVSGAAGPRSVASATLGCTELGIAIGFALEMAVGMRFWTAAEADGTPTRATTATYKADATRSRGREVPRMGKSFCFSEMLRNLRP